MSAASTPGDGSFVVAACTVTLRLPENDSLKGKRAVVKSILDRVRARFNVSAAEIADLDVHQSAVIGFAAVSNDTQHANSVADNVRTFILENVHAMVVGSSLELVHLGVREARAQATLEVWKRS